MRQRRPPGERKKVCSKCRQPNDRPGQRYCRSCHAEYMRNTRPSYREYSEEQKAKANARVASHRAMAKGILKKEPCAVCGEDKVERHHNDYSKPLDVVWLCRKHHKQVHKEKGGIF